MVNEKKRQAALKSNERWKDLKVWKNRSVGIKKSYNENDLRERRSEDAKKQWETNPKNQKIQSISNFKKMLNAESKKINFKKGRPVEKSSEERTCNYCGKRFIFKDFSDRAGLFCSHKCYINFSKQNAVNYRIKAFALLPNKCFYCSERDGQKLLVHHKGKNHLNNDIKNLEIVCRKCHSKLHKTDDSRKLRFKDSQILRAWRDIIDGLRLDLNDPNFKETPARILRSYYEMYPGIDAGEEIKEILDTKFPITYKGLIIEGPIRCYSMCPHHFLPVIYDVYVGYVPSDSGLGLSKIPRLVELLASAPKLQETFTEDIVDKIDITIKSKGVMSVVFGNHLCMQARGLKKPGCTTITSSVRGIFLVDDGKFSVKEEFLRLIKLQQSG